MRLDGYGLPPEHEAEIDFLYQNGHIGGKIAIDIACKCSESGMSPTEIWAEEGYCLPLSEGHQLPHACIDKSPEYVAEAMAANPEERDEKKLLGLALKHGRGRMNPVAAMEEIQRILKLHR